MDEGLFWAINAAFDTPSWGRIMLAVTSPEMWVAPAVFATGAFLARKKKLAAIAILAAILAAALGDALAHNVIKPAAARKRPCAALEHVHITDGVGCTDSFSFPSNHAVNTFAVAAAAGAVFPPSLLVLAPVAVMVGLSRVAVGVHYPSDVAAGALLGILIGVGVGAMAKRLAGSLRTEERSADG
jgi:undecaprenyl-diphosphatase